MKGMPKVKAVVRIKDTRGRGRFLTRVVIRIEQVGKIQAPPDFSSHDPSWKILYDWQFYKGVARIDYEDLTVWGWSFIDDKPPLYWVYDFFEYRHRDMAAWDWLSRHESTVSGDDFELAYISPPAVQVAATKIWDFLGKEVLMDYLGDGAYKPCVECQGISTAIVDDDPMCMRHWRIRQANAKGVRRLL